jgi:hypothetical protein
MLEFYCIRHKKTGFLMPAFKRMGYTIWKPENPSFTKSMELGGPRLFCSVKSAERAIVAWETGAPPDYDMEGRPLIRLAREKGQLEFVQCKLTLEA